MNIEDLKGCFANVSDDTLLRENGLLYAENKQKDKEIERLNNIINELETWINSVKTFDDICVYEDYSGRWGIQPKYILDKLKELKESEK